MRRWLMRVRIEGLNLERLITQAAEEGLVMSDVRRKSPRCMTADVQEDDLPQLKELVQRGGWLIQTERRYGLGRAAEWIKRRWLLAGALCAALLLLGVATQLMWAITLVDAGSYEADLRAYLDAEGIHPPMLRSGVDVAGLQAKLEWRYPRVAWIECGWRGMTLEIRMVEGVLPEEDTNSGAMDVVASRDCIVDTILTAAGTPQVKPGEIVHKGQVLILGEERTGDGLTRPVPARGTVLARVWEGASITMSAWETITEYTGRTNAVHTVASPCFDLWRLPDSGYECEDVSVSVIPLGGFFLPLTIRTEVRHEARYTRKPLEADVLYAQAEQAAVQKLYKNMRDTDSLVDKWVNCSMIDAEKLQAVAIGEMLIDVGMQVPSSGMAAAE